MFTDFGEDTKAEVEMSEENCMLSRELTGCGFKQFLFVHKRLRVQDS